MTDNAMTETVFEAHRQHLGAVAARVLGSATEAEDVVQEAWLRWRRVDRAEVADPRGYLIRVVTRLALDRLRRHQTRREEPSDSWLPEPADPSPGAAEAVEVAEAVSQALLVVLETLSPLERAVFVPREAFACSHAEVAAVLGRSEPAVRQLAHRARRHVEARRPRFDVDPATSQQVVERFRDACETGGLDGLLTALAPDVVLVGDGDDRAELLQRPILGADTAARFLLAALAAPPPGAPTPAIPVAGGRGMAAEFGDPVGAVVHGVAGGAVRTIRLVAAPSLARSAPTAGNPGRQTPRPGSRQLVYSSR